MPKSLGPGPSMIGFAWYRESDWPRVKSQFSDGAALHDTFDEWRRDAEKMVREAAARGIIVTQITIDIDDFIGWCMVHGRKRDGKARSEYVTEKMRAGLLPLDEQKARQADLRAALIEGEQSGQAEPFDIEAFVMAKRDTSAPE